jgi:hypothetical protein
VQEEQGYDVNDTLRMLHAELERGEAPSPAVEALIRQANEQLAEAKRNRNGAPPPQPPQELPAAAVVRRSSPMRSHVRPEVNGSQPRTGGSQQPMQRSSLLLGIVALAVLGLVGVGAYTLLRPQAEQAAPAPSPPKATSQPVVAPAQKAERSPGLPDPTLTPGERVSTPQASDPIPEATAKQVLAAYKVSDDPKRNVLCRLIPASLGGTSNPKNLFPTTPWFADLKARLDKYLTGQVKAGKMTAEQAEKELKNNWIQAVHTYNIRNYGVNDAAKAKETEDKLRW